MSNPDLYAKVNQTNDNKQNHKKEFRLKPVSLEKNRFVTNDGRTIMPSLITFDAEQDFKIKRSFEINGYIDSLDSIQHIHKYQIYDQYLDVYQRLTGEDKYWLKFIGRFKSVQALQLQNQLMLSNGVLQIQEMWNSVNRLLKFGLLQKWKYYHPAVKKDISVFTLSGNGFRFLETFWGDQHYFQPQNFYTLQDKFHLRFWETVDVYQVLSSLPVFKNFQTLFNGYLNKNKKIIASPLQISMELLPNRLNNLIFYTALQTDNSLYYKTVITDWNNLTERGKDMNLKIKHLPQVPAVLTFYAPTLKTADRLSQSLQMQEQPFTILFLVGEKVKAQGLPYSFYLPSNRNGQLQQLSLSNLIEKS